MDEQEPDKQFEATDYDESGNIKTLSAQPPAAKKKRVTVADLNKAIDDIREVKFPETLNWLGEVDARTDVLEQMGLENLPQSIVDLTERFKRLEDFIGNSTVKAISEIKAGIDNQDEAIGALADALRQHIEEAAAAPPEPKQEIEFAQPPVIPEQVTATKGDIEAVASVCQSMTDVLMICRALKAVPDLPDDDRTYLLTTACRAAGVPLSVGLQIRAGAKHGEA